MATRRLPFGRVVEAFRDWLVRANGGRDPLRILEDMDRCRNLPAGVAIAVFFVSAAVGIFSFFAINDLALWMGVSKQVASALIAISWVLIFPIWALAFLLVMSVLYAAGVRDLQAIARSSLASRTLSRAQLRELQDALASRTWRHGRLFKDVLAELTNERTRFGH